MFSEMKNEGQRFFFNFHPNLIGFLELHIPHFMLALRTFLFRSVPVLGSYFDKGPPVRLLGTLSMATFLLQNVCE